MKIRSLLFLIIVFASAAISIDAQMSPVAVPPKSGQPAQAKPAQNTLPNTPPPVPEDHTWWYLSLFLLGGGLLGAIGWKLSTAKAAKLAEEEKLNSKNKKKKKDDPLDADKEMEWLRQNHEYIDKRRKRTTFKEKLAKKNLPNSRVIAENAINKELEINVSIKDMQLVGSKGLPIFHILTLEPTSPFNQLSLSNDDGLIGAIEQTHEEDEEDEQVRDLALKILAMFRNRNSVEALSQMALYDLSSSLRVKAVVTLTEFDHESVFETILLACADPSREVRAAAARGLTKLSFNRADAWTRIIETTEQWRMKQAARAAIESGFAERSFERLVYNDYKQVYEAFALLCMMVEADEIDMMLSQLENNPNKHVKLAILHIFKVADATNALPFLYKYATREDLDQEISDALENTVHQVGSLEMIA